MVHKSNGARRYIDALFLAVLLSLSVGCATVQRPTTALLEMANSQEVMSDKAIVSFSVRTLEHYGMRALNAEILSTSGEISLFTLSTATVAMAAGGANPAATMATASVGNWLLRILGIVKPDQRDAAFNEGSEDILRAIGDYVVTLAGRGVYIVPTDRMTNPGAVLLRKTLAAMIAVNRQMVGLRPKFDDLETLKISVPPMPEDIKPPTKPLPPKPQVPTQPANPDVG